LVLGTGPGKLSFVAGSDRTCFLFSLLVIFCFKGSVSGKHHIVVKFVVARNPGIVTTSCIQ
jgi:hypothetical protein